MRPLDVLTVLNLPEDIVNECREILASNAGSIQAGRPPNVGAAVFGGSEKGQLLEHHTSIAHQHVAEALEKMVEGLRGYADSLGGFAKDMREQDDQAAADLSRHQSGVDLTRAERRALDDSTNRTSRPDFHHDDSDTSTEVMP